MDETYFGGLEANKHESQRKHRPGGLSGKAPVIGVKDRESGQVRAQAIPNTEGGTLRRFVREHAQPGAQVYSDGHSAYSPLEGEYRHNAVQHSVGTLRDRAGAHERDRVVLVDVEARLPGHLPQDERKHLTATCGVRATTSASATPSSR